MFLSASDLCKRSAAQIFYLRRHQNKVIVTPEQLAGIKKQANNSSSKYIEMRAGYRFKDIVINFSWDEVQEATRSYNFIEHKSVLNNYEDWYLEKSLLQTALYAALTGNIWKFETAVFHVKRGNPKQVLELDYKPKKYYLKFGDTTYKVSVLGEASLIQFLIRKAKASLTYDTAISFDKKWKYKEFEKLKDCFAFRKV